MIDELEIIRRRLAIDAEVVMKSLAEQRRKKIQADVDDFLLRGGQIQQIPRGATAGNMGLLMLHNTLDENIINGRTENATANGNRQGRGKGRSSGY